MSASNEPKTRGKISPITRLPFPVKAFSELPVLSEEDGRLILVAGGFGGIVTVFEAIKDLDPWASSQGPARGPLFLLAVVVLWGVSLSIAYKQWHYYYPSIYDTHGKQGFFVKSIRQVSPLERTVDYLLAFLGGTLIAVAFAPVLWFFFLGTYSVFVAVRSALVLRRNTFAARLRAKGIDVPPWYGLDRQAVHENAGKSLNLVEVLWGWIISSAFLGVYAFGILSLMLVYFLSMAPEAQFTFHVFGVVGVVLIFFSLKNKSHRWAKWLLARKGPEPAKP